MKKLWRWTIVVPLVAIPALAATMQLTAAEPDNPAQRGLGNGSEVGLALFEGLVATQGEDLAIPSGVRIEVQAFIDGQQCGKGDVSTDEDNRLVYAAKVPSDGQIAGCGVPGSPVRFELNVWELRNLSLNQRGSCSSAGRWGVAEIDLDLTCVLTAPVTPGSSDKKAIPPIQPSTSATFEGEITTTGENLVFAQQEFQIVINAFINGQHCGKGVAYVNQDGIPEYSENVWSTLQTSGCGTAGDPVTFELHVQRLGTQNQRGSCLPGGTWNTGNNKLYLVCELTPPLDPTVPTVTPQAPGF